MKNFFANFFTGFLVIAAVGTPTLAICTGGTDIFQTIFIGIFCSILLTFGLALLIYIPVICLVGYVTLLIIRIFSHAMRPNTPVPTGKTSADKNVNAIAYYLRRSKDPVRNIEAISRELKNAGWDDKTIDAAYDELMKKQD